MHFLLIRYNGQKMSTYLSGVFESTESCAQPSSQTRLGDECDVGGFRLLHAVVATGYPVMHQCSHRRR